MKKISPENIQLIRSLFKGREDVFAVRWEKGSKSGYMPSYFYDAYRLRIHKMNGGTFQNFTEKNQVMKIRFVLNPFSFVFLLTGVNSYFIVLETLDTEEATYIWHTPKIRLSLIDEVQQIDNQLSIIREKGRQLFLENSPDNFIRILHDYSENQEGFVKWKSALEEII